MRIKTKILLPMITFTLLVAVAILVSNSILFSGFVDTSTLDRLDSATAVALDKLDSLKAEATAVSFSIAKDPLIIEALAENDRGRLLARASELQSETGFELCTFTDAEGMVIARTHAPESFGDSVVEQANVRSAMGGQPLTAVIEEGTFVQLSVRAGTPVYDSHGAIAGVVSAGFRLDTEAYVDSIKNMMGCEVTVVLGDTRISTTILQEDGTRAVGTKADAQIVETVLAGETYSGRVDMLGRVAVANYVPLMGPENEAIGMLFIGQYYNEELAIIWDFVQSGGIITLFILGAVIIVILAVTGHITRPIRDMTGVATALADGNTELRVDVKTKDEMRSLADAFNRMIEDTRQQVSIIERIAGGDMDVSPKMRSEKDVMNRSLQKLSVKLQEQAAALKEEHERIKLMLDATPLASRLWDRDYNLIECNEAAVKMFGLTSKQEYMDRYFELAPEYQPDGQKTRDKARMLVRRALEDGSYSCDYLYQMPDGTLIPSEVRAVRVPYGNDFVVASYSRDLREQQKMMSEIEQRDHLLQTVNQAADMLLRSETGDFSGTLYQCMGMMARSINADRMYLCKNHTIDGGLYCTQLYEWSENAPPLQDTGIMADVSYDEKTPEIKKALLCGKSVHMLVRDMGSPDCDWLAAQGILSVLITPIYIRNEFWGFVGFDNCHSEELFTENEESIMRSGSLLVTNALLRNEYMTDIRDASAKLEVALADAENANNAKSNFLAHMSHEIRTPLNVVVGLSELMLDHTGLGSEVENKLENIHTSGMTILSIVNDILDISKIESGSFEIFPVQYDTPSLINDIVTLNIVRIKEKDILFKLVVDERLPATLFGDDLRVKQVFNNLLSNAFKYTNSGFVEWKISYKIEEGSVWLISSVEDTGVGIKPEDVQRLFSDYHQLDMQTNRKVEGTGLGLAITKRLVEMMDGGISVESEYGKGSIFRVRLRQGYVSDTAIGKEIAGNLMDMRYVLSKRDRNTQLARVNLSYAHVLIVDDIVTNLDVVKGMLKPYELKMDCATSGAQAIDMIRAENPRYAAVFMDHMMPGMDGIEAVRIIREELGTEYARNVPVIALTANAIVGNEEMFLSRGFQAFISKPIDIMKLDAVLRRWVRNKELEKEAADDTNTGESAQEHAGPGAGNEVFPFVEAPLTGGMDMVKALERFGGDEKVLWDVLRSYAVNTKPLLGSLRDYLAAENLEDYATVIHGIKGSSYGIFAQKAGETAEELELAAKIGDLEIVKGGHVAFEIVVGELLESIQSLLDSIDAVTNKPAKGMPDSILLMELREACEAYDMDGVDAAMEKLESYRYENGQELVLWLREQVNNMDFEVLLCGEWPPY